MADLIKATIVGSYNDAAIALALHCGGTNEGFVDMMNQQATNLGLGGTSFANPTGAHDTMNYTTARDMLLIYKKIYSVRFLKECIDKAYVTIPATNKSKERTFWTGNGMSTGYYGTRYVYSYAKGGKASSSTLGGCSVACAAVKGNSSFICIVLGSVQDESVNYSFVDAKEIFEYGFNDFTRKTILHQDSIVAEVKVKNAMGVGRSLLLAEKTVNFYIKNDDDISKVESVRNIPEFISAPTVKGDVVGSINYTYNGRNAGSVSLIAGNDIKLNRTKYVLNSILWFFSLKYIKLFLIIAFSTVVVYLSIVFSVILKARKKTKKTKIKKIS